MRYAAFIVLLLTPISLRAQRTQGPMPEIVPFPDSVLPRTHAPQPTSAAISPQDLMTRLYIFADDSMMGREAGTLGNVRGTDYLAREAAKIGLGPAGDSGSYFQTIPMRTRSVDTTSTLIVDGTPLVFGRDWSARGAGSVSATAVPVIFGGTASDSTDMISPEAAAGKVVVFAFAGMSWRTERRLARILPEAAAVVGIVPPQGLGFVNRPVTFLDDPVEGSGRERVTALYVTAAGAAKLFDQPLDQLAPGTLGKTVDLHIRVNLDPPPFPARNVVAILPGSDPTVAGEYVAIGAHNDHIGLSRRPVDHDSLRIHNHIVRPQGAEDFGQATPQQQAEVNARLAKWRAAHPASSRPDSIDNGADDDGSGSVSMLEIAQYLASLTPGPRRSILFVWHVAEEKGLYGSTYFANHPTVPRDSIVAQLNMDMVGRGDAWDVTGRTIDGMPIHGGPNYLQLVGSRRLSTELGDLVEMINHAKGHELRFDYSMDANGHPDNIYCRSDHYEYARYGIPIVFFTTGVHSDYHQVTDEPQYIDYDHMARVDRLVADVALEVANLDHRVVVDHSKPDPQGGCRQ